MHLHRTDPDLLVGLLSLDDVDQLLTETAIRTPAVRIAQDGAVLPEARYTRLASLAGRPLTGLVDARKVAALFDGGATVVLHPMVCAYMDSPPEFMAMTRGKLRAARSFFGSKEDWVKLPIVAFLVEHPGAGPIIIDTGFHPSVAVDPKQNLGPVYGRIYRIDMRPEQAIPAQLREQHGIEPADVDPRYDAD